MEWDWRNASDGVLLPIKMQTMNCCWAIVTIESIVAATKIKHPNEELSELSMQELIDCCKADERLPYNYGYIRAFQWIKANGIRKEKDYPFKDYKFPCKSKTQEEKKSAVYIADILKINTQNESELLDMVRKQPVVGSIKVYKELQDYSGGIYEGPENPNDELRGLHGILIIGFGQEQGKNYWLIKNSWGTEWGIGGYGKVARDSSLPENRKNIIFKAACPVVF